MCFNLDLYQWLVQIGNNLRMQSIYVWVGFSFLMKKSSPQGDTIIYCYAARELALERSKLHTRELWDEFTDKFKHTTEFDILNSLWTNKDDNPFKQSGFHPYKLVTACVLIR